MFVAGDIEFYLIAVDFSNFNTRSKLDMYSLSCGKWNTNFGDKTMIYEKYSRYII